jgi:hypothetical protein
MTSTTTLTATDRAAVAEFLRDYGYVDLTEWALDSGYYVIDTPKFYGWLDENDNHVDLEAECFRAVVSAGEAQDEARYGF